MTHPTIDHLEAEVQRLSSSLAELIDDSPNFGDIDGQPGTIYSPGTVDVSLPMERTQAPVVAPQLNDIDALYNEMKQQQQRIVSTSFSPTELNSVLAKSPPLPKPQSRLPDIPFDAANLETQAQTLSVRPPSRTLTQTPPRMLNIPSPPTTPPKFISTTPITNDNPRLQTIIEELSSQLQQARLENKHKQSDLAKLSESLNQSTLKINTLQIQLESARQEAETNADHLKHAQTLFDQAHADNQEKYARLDKLETEYERVRIESQNKETELLKVQSSLQEVLNELNGKEAELKKAYTLIDQLTVQVDSGSKSAAISPPEQELQSRLESLRAENSKLLSKLEISQKENMELKNHLSAATQNDTSNARRTSASSSVSSEPAMSPSQMRAMNKLFENELDKERSEFFKKIKSFEKQLRDLESLNKHLEEENIKLSGELQQERALHNQYVNNRNSITTNGSSFQSLPPSPVSPNPDAKQQYSRVKLGPSHSIPPFNPSLPAPLSEEATVQILQSTYQTHLEHLKSLLIEKHNISEHYTETISSLSLKLSYWVCLKEVYEEMIDELWDWCKNLREKVDVE